MGYFMYDVNYVKFFRLVFEHLVSCFTVLSIINGTVHFLICFFMSTQYRSTVRKLLGLKETIIHLHESAQKDSRKAKVVSASRSTRSVISD